MKKCIQISAVVFLIMVCNVYLSFAQEEIKYENVNLNESCFGWDFLIDVPQFERDKGKPYLDDEWVIDSEETYLDFQKRSEFARNQVCAKVDFPSIDFSQRTLLVKSLSGSCATTGFDRTVVKDDKKKEIIYSIKVIERFIPCSGRGLVVRMNLITIPKVPKDYKVRFLPANNHLGYQFSTCEEGKMVTRDWNGNIVPGGGVFGVQADCSDVSVSLQKLSMEAKKLLIMSGSANIPPPCPDGTSLQDKYCMKGNK